MVTSVDTTIEINYISALEREVEGCLEFPVIELTKIRRHITLVRLPYANIYSVYGKLPKD